MKSMKTMRLSCVLVLSVFLAGCMGPALPKDAYMNATRAMESAKSYEKTSDIQLNMETRGLWQEQESVFFSLLNETDIKATAVVDQTKGIQSTNLKLAGGFAYMPLDSTLHFVQDMSKNTTYLQGNSLTSFVQSLAPDTWEPSTQWIELNTSKQNPLQNVDVLFENLSEEQFVRREVTLEEKKEGIRDVITVTVASEDIQKTFPALKNTRFEGITFQASLDRKGRLLKEKTTAKWLYQNYKKELVVHGVATTAYQKVNEAITVPALPKKELITTLETFFHTETKTEKP